MIQNILFLDSTYKRLISACSETTEPFSGLLIGLENDQSCLVLGHYYFDQPNPKYFAEQYEAAIDLLPFGYQVVGYFFKSPQAHLHNVVKNLCKKIFTDGSFQHNCISSNHSGRDILIGVMDEGSQPDMNLYRFNPSSQLISSAFKATNVSEEQMKKMCSRYAMFHLCARLPFSFLDTHDPADRKLSIETSMSMLAHQVNSSVVCFKVTCKSRPNKPLLLKGCDESKISKICNHFGRFTSDARESAKDGFLLHELFSVEVLTKMTDVGSAENETGFLTCVPVLHHDHVKCTLVKMDLPIDLLLILDLGQKTNEDDDDDGGDDDDDDDDGGGDDDQEDAFLEVIKRQLRVLSDSIIASGKESSYSVPRPHHFKVPNTGVLITCIYPEDVEEAKLAPIRKDLHQRLLVSPTSPTFRRTNKLSFNRQMNDLHGYLVDVHLGLARSKANGRVSLVQGSYHYRHYMQDKMDDKGWGCAYRSLQTIASWLLLQGFTDRAPPTHVEIQQALVDVGDKPTSFINSRQWIGSTEVSYVLDHLYNVQSKISHASNGEEMMLKVREIAHHFETQGTPIMIGGGALAHTIIGIDFNEDTGDVCYLILDPHYTGSEDIKVIQSKGWCGWKGPEFWKANCFYNMCMPFKSLEY